jgi:TetR/AcrR family transcriptional regulator
MDKLMDNRSKILSCALELFAARGYDAVGVQEIVDAACITKPTLYHYFGSKRGLLETLLAVESAPMFAAIERAASYRGDLSLTLHRVAAAYFGYAQAHRLTYRMQLAMWFAPPDSDAHVAVSGLNGRQQQLLETLFVQAAEDHGNMRGRHRAYAATFLGMVHTYVGLALNGYVVLDDDLTYRAVHQYMHGIFS